MKKENLKMHKEINDRAEKVVAAQEQIDAQLSDIKDFIDNTDNGAMYSIYAENRANKEKLSAYENEKKYAYLLLANIWEQYKKELTPLAETGKIELPTVPQHCVHNAHMFYIKVKDLTERTKLIAFLKEKGVNAVFHYIPLHTSPAGKQFGVFSGEDKYTTKESERLLRLPMYYNIEEQDVIYIAEKVREFYK